MTDDPNARRRTLIQSLAGLSIAPLARGEDAPRPATPALPPTGRPGDFEFLSGSWTISHRKRKAPGRDEWDTFAGEATVWSILAGVGSVEELRIPARNFSGMGLRLLDVEKKVWSDFWVNSRSGVLTAPGTSGVFENGVGTFVADEEDQGRAVKVRGVWDRITPRSCRWYQSVSRDGGRTWEDDWLMDWTRA